MLDPAYDSWWSAVPALVVAGLVLFLPGGVLASLLGAPRLLAAAVGPVITVTILTFGGATAAALGVSWGWGALVVSSLAAWLLALGASRFVSGSSKVPRPTPPPGERPWHRRLGGAVGLLGAFTVVAAVLVRASGSPRMFPQHPDTIFHLGDATWMARHHDISYFDAGQFNGPGQSGGYPTGFHSVTATVSLLSGAPVVVATSATVLVALGVVWPLAMWVLAESQLGARPAVALVAPLLAVTFPVFPFQLMGFGVLWPNALGQALLPAVLALCFAWPGSRRMSRWRIVLLVAACLPGLVMAHPSAFVSGVLFLAVWLLTVVVRRWWAHRAEGPRALWPLAATVGALVVAAGLSAVVRPQLMVATGAPGPETGVMRAIFDTVFFAPRGAPVIYALPVLVAAGAYFAWRLVPRAAWCVPAVALTMVMFFLNIAVDDHLARYLTWPWYNQATRLATLGVIPAILLATTGITVAAAQLERVLRPAVALRFGAAAISASLVAVLLVPTLAWTGSKTHWLRKYFYPTTAMSWASQSELASMSRLAAKVPADSVIAENPWNGGSYLYLVANRTMLYPTEKTDNTPARRLLGRELDRVGVDPRVCQTANQLHVWYAMTGGQPFAWGRPAQLAAYRGVDAVDRSPSWQMVARDGEYTLYRRAAC